MDNKKYDYRAYVKEEVNKVKTESALKNWKPNIIGIGVSSAIFLSLI